MRKKPTLSGKSTVRRLITALKKTSVYSQLNKRNPIASKSVARFLIPAENAEKYSMIINNMMADKSCEESCSIDRSVILQEAASRMGVKSKQQRNTSLNKFSTTLSTDSNHRKKMRDICEKVINQQFRPSSRNPISSRIFNAQSTKA